MHSLIQLNGAIFAFCLLLQVVAEKPSSQALDGGACEIRPRAGAVIGRVLHQIHVVPCGGNYSWRGHRSIKNVKDGLWKRTKGMPPLIS